MNYFLCGFLSKMCYLPVWSTLAHGVFILIFAYFILAYSGVWRIYFKFVSLRIDFGYLGIDFGSLGSQFWSSGCQFLDSESQLWAPGNLLWSNVSQFLAFVGRFLAPGVDSGPARRGLILVSKNRVYTSESKFWPRGINFRALRFDLRYWRVDF